MEINLGPCHYDGGDDATMTAVHPQRIGWIAVCRSHAGKAEQEGYRVNEVGGERGPTSPYPDEPGTPRWSSSGEEALPQPEPAEGGLDPGEGDLDVLDRILGRSATEG